MYADMSFTSRSSERNSLHSAQAFGCSKDVHWATVLLDLHASVFNLIHDNTVKDGSVKNSHSGEDLNGRHLGIVTG